MLSAAFSDSGWSGLDQAAKAVFLARFTRDVSPRDSGPTPPVVPGATSFMAVDRTGQTVACVIGMGSPLGLGNVASGTGIFLRPAIDAGPGVALAVIAGNRNTWQVQLGATAGGGEAAYSTLVQTVLNHYDAGQSVSTAIESPRVHPDPGASKLYVEDAMGAASVSGFTRMGLSIKMTPTLGVSALFRCVNGLSKSNTDCELAGDPRGGGLVLFER